MTGLSLVIEVEIEFGKLSCWRYCM